MSRNGTSKAGKFLIGATAAALVAIALVTGLYYWKGLERLPARAERQESEYYFVYEP